MAKAISINQFYNQSIEEIVSSINPSIIVSSVPGGYELRLDHRKSMVKKISYSPERGFLELVAGLNRLSDIPDLGINIDPRGRWVYMTVDLREQWRWMTCDEWKTLEYLHGQVKHGNLIEIGSPCWRRYIFLKREIEERYGGFTAVGVGDLY